MENKEEINDDNKYDYYQDDYYSNDDDDDKDVDDNGIDYNINTNIEGSGPEWYISTI